KEKKKKKDEDDEDNKKFYKVGEIGTATSMKKKKKLDLKSDEKKKVSLTFEDKEASLADFKKRTLEEIKRVEAMDSKNKDRGGTLREGKLGYVVGRNSDGRIGGTEPLNLNKPAPKADPAKAFFGSF
ncbi:MAG: hypothetical protein Q8Q35_02740, partial [Nanoarchaeota archaeon]|nr:hypothetical protein [Nanoarchaeota archaeon]